MNPRSFTIMDTDSQVTKVIESTVAELKRDLRAAGFNVENKTIQEGVSGIEFKTDDAILPHDVPYNGTITNDLVFRLTKAQKHINSGAMSRPEAYAAVKKLGLQEVIAKKYGKNFTMCKTADLIAEVEKAEKKAAAPAPKAEAEKPAPKTEKKVEQPAAPGCKKGEEEKCKAIAGLVELVGCLINNGHLSLADGKKIADIVGAELPAPKGGIYSKAELDNMFRGMK